MKGFLRSKLVLALATLVILAGAIAIPLSNNIIHSHAASLSTQASWNIVPSPSPSTSSNTLQAVSTYDATHAWAVGSYRNADLSDHDFIEYWNGTSWTQQTGANPGAVANNLYGVKALSATDVWAVGCYIDANHNENVLIEHTTDGGNTWTQDSYTGSGCLIAIDGDPSTGDAWAVGGNNNALTLHLTNGHFELQTNVTPNSAVQLTGVSEHSSNDVWAVGYDYGNNPFTTFTIHWEVVKGKYQWVTKSSPNLSSDVNYLTGVTNIGSGDAWAVGRNVINSYSNVVGTLMHWNGSAWSTPLTVPVGNDSALYAVVAASSNNIWAAGTYHDSSSNIYYPLIWHSSDGGTTWNKETIGGLNSGSISNNFYGIGIDSNSNMWAVGYQYLSGHTETLIAQYTPSPSPTTHNQLVIFLQGISSKLTNGDISSGTITGMGIVPSTVRRIFPNARFLEYSYSGSGDTGVPLPYDCLKTFSSPVETEILTLDVQILKALSAEPPNTETDIYLIGHSLGGAVALGFLDYLKQGVEVLLPGTAHLKAVITLDSPLGGFDSGWLSFFATTVTGVYALPSICSPLVTIQHASLDDLVNVFNSTSSTTPPDDAGPDPQGALVSILKTSTATLPTPIPSNEDLAEAAQPALGTSFLSIGNLNDFVFNPQKCLSTAPSFPSTQFLEDKGNTTGIYGRDIAPSPDTCPNVFLHNPISFAHFMLQVHTEVLSDPDVQTGITTFLTPIISEAVGGTPLSSSGTPLPINPYQPSQP